jgi:hypothetical protein
MTNDQMLALADQVFADRKNMSTFTFFATNVELIEFANLIAAAQRVEDADIAVNLDIEKAEDYDMNSPYFAGWERGCIDCAATIRGHK